MLSEEVRSLFERILPDQTLLNIQHLNEGHAATTFRIECANEQFFLKLMEHEVCRLESAVLIAMMGSGCKVPEVVYTSESPEIDGKACFIMRGVSGQFIYQQGIQERSRYLPLIGREVAKIHQIETLGYGKLTHITHGKFVGEADTAKASAFSKLEQELNVLKEHLLNHKEWTILSDALHYNEGLLTEGRQVLNHGDLTMNHVFVNEKKVSGIIDLGNARSSDPHHDLAIIRLEWPDDILLIVKGYQDQLEFDFSAVKLNFYTILSCIQRVGWCLDHGITNNSSLKWFRRMAELSLLSAKSL